MNTIGRRQFLSAAASAAALSAFPRLSSAQGNKGGTLVFIVQPEAPTLASYLTPTTPTAQIASKVYDGLLEYDFDLSPKPSLAESWKVSPDGKTITFVLRRGVKFHDGRPFTSADVKFSIVEVLKKYHSRGPLTFRDVTDIETPDSHTAIFRLSQPAPYLMSGLSGFESPIIPKHLFDGTDVKTSKYATAPVGTGPYKFTEWKRGEYIRLDRNPDYWKPNLPGIDRLVVRFIPDSSTRTAALETGEAHVAGFGAILNSDVRRLEKLPFIEVTTKGYEMTSPVVESHLNTQRPPFDNKLVRQAIAYSLDRQFVIDNIWFGFGRLGTGPINSNLKRFYSSDVRNYNVANRIEMANKLLDEAGYKRDASGTRFEITHDVLPFGEEWKRFGEYTKQQFEKLGIRTILRAEDFPTWTRRIYTDYDFQMMSSWVSNLGDPVVGIHREYHSNSIRKGVPFVNASRWSSARVDQLLDAATVELDEAKRAAMYKEFQQIVAEEVPVICWFELFYVTVSRKAAKDLVVDSLGLNASFDRARMS